MHFILHALLFACAFSYQIIRPMEEPESEQQSLITIIDCNGKELHANEKLVATVLPQIYERFKKSPDRAIAFNGPFESSDQTLKKHQKKELLEELFRIYQDSVYAPITETINQVFEAGIYFNSPDLILKRLTYYAKKVLSQQEQHPLIQEGHFSYSIEELLNEKFFTLEKIVTTHCLSSSLHCGPGVKRYTVRLNLSDYNIGSLDGIELLEKLDDGWFSNNKVTKIKLDKNCLKHTNLEQICNNFPNLEDINLSENQLSELNLNILSNELSFINLCNNKFQSLPKTNYLLRINLQNNPLCAQARFEARSDNPLNCKINFLLYIPFGLGIAYLLNKCSPIAFNHLSKYINLSPKTSHLITSFASQFPIKTLCFLNCSVPMFNSLIMMHAYKTDFIINENKTYYESLEELAIRLKEISYNFFTNPYHLATGLYSFIKRKYK
jgi:hypothetical protein